MPMTISMDEDLKKDFAEVCREIGLSSSAAINIFAKAVVRERGIPFLLSAKGISRQTINPYDETILQGLWQGFNDREAGNYITREASRALRNKKAVTL